MVKYRKSFLHALEINQLQTINSFRIMVFLFLSNSTLNSNRKPEVCFIYHLCLEARFALSVAEGSNYFWFSGI